VAQGVTAAAIHLDLEHDSVIDRYGSDLACHRAD
jgi:hypothetical protein